MLDKLPDISQKKDDDVDAEDDEEVKKESDGESKTINVNDEKVKDRWSRYIGAMGIEAVAK